MIALALVGCTTGETNGPEGATGGDEAAPSNAQPAIERPAYEQSGDNAASAPLAAGQGQSAEGDGETDEGADGRGAADRAGADAPRDPLPPDDTNHTIGEERALAPNRSKKYELPEGFVYLDEVLEGAQYDIRYYGDNNFVGTRIDGYLAPLAIMQEEAAGALQTVQQALQEEGYVLKIFDAYRPQKAVDHFKRWSQDATDTKMKDDYYPELDKRRLFELGFIASRSGHSRGSTVDLTLADAATGEEVDMGGPFDFFGPVSSHGTELIGEEQAAARAVLKSAMVLGGFRAYDKEWWHYTYENEPQPRRYYDFDVQ
ncbi:M15 family metallopeptidase [Paenibacillus sp. IB182496]|uniref:D-alanyl-D-alanine dipeptidase n=2 Tax=Paenibacillus sabuli TaxID=2772509 RepID=A0A927GU04_9BACL|nr:M15 family metallopeptidase [Paenibacillus sabuli]